MRPYMAANLSTGDFTHLPHWIDLPHASTRAFNMSFTTLGLSPELTHAAANRGLQHPTEIQKQTIPAILDGRDILGLAPTGSGKTLAYALPILMWLLKQTSARNAPGYRRTTKVLVLVPTRELAVQAGDVFQSMCCNQQHPTPRIGVAFGGVSINPQMMALRGGVDVMVATPGRLLDLIDQNALHIEHVHTLVLDEADRLLDTGFADEMQQILAKLPAKRQNLFFSATFAPSVKACADTLLRNPIQIQIDATVSTVPDITQRAIAVDEKKRTQLLRHLLQDPAWSRVLVFVATQYTAEHVAEKLYKAGIFATPFHGRLSQGARNQVLQELKDHRWQVVVTTDLASRGIDVVELPVVVNYDLPRSADSYTHRIGRTGRAGAKGIAVSLVPAASLAHWRIILKRQKLHLPLEVVAGFEPQDTVPVTITTSAETANANGGIKGKRPSKKDKLRAAAALLHTK